MGNFIDKDTFSKKSIFKYLEFGAVLGGAYTMWMVFMLILRT